MKLSSPFWTAVSRLCIALFLAGCHPSPGKLAVVTGKTVFGNLAVEGARLEIERWEPNRWEHHSTSESGYHGAFRLHLPPGRYRITARKTVRMGTGEIAITGVLEGLIVDRPRGRIDQIVIEMGPEGDPG